MWRQNNKLLKGKKNLSRKKSENMSNQRKMETQLSKTYSIEHKQFYRESYNDAIILQRKKNNLK